MINQDKPTVGVPQTYLNIGGGFRLLVGSTFRLIAGAVGIGGMTNSAKVSIGTTWDTWTTAWDDETKTWDQLSQLIDNATKQTTSITNEAKPI